MFISAPPPAYVAPEEKPNKNRTRLENQLRSHADIMPIKMVSLSLTKHCIEFNGSEFLTFNLNILGDIKNIINNLVLDIYNGKPQLQLLIK